MPHKSTSSVASAETEAETPPSFGMSSVKISLIARLESLLRNLYGWRWRWQAKFGRGVISQPCQDMHWSIASETRTFAPSNPLYRQARIAFTQSNYAADIMLYNAVLIWVLAILWRIQPVLATSIIQECADFALETVLDEQSNRDECDKRISRYMSFEPLRRPGSSLSVRDPAVEICRVYEWQSQHHGESGSEPNLLYMFPLGMAMSVLGADGKSRRWISSLLNADPLTQGYGGYPTTWRSRSRDSEESCAASRSHTDYASDDGFGGNKRGSKNTPLYQEAGDDFERIKDFGHRLLREVVDPETLYSEDSRSVSRGYHPAASQPLNPGIVHLLLLRGRTTEV